MSKAIDDVIAERLRQIESEGWDTEHDDEHDDESLAQAAVCYATPDELKRFVTRTCTAWVPCPRTDGSVRQEKELSVPDLWPHSWHGEHWKPKNRRRDLVRAAALIIAEIERIDRINS